MSAIICSYLESLFHERYRKENQETKGCSPKPQPVVNGVGDELRDCGMIDADVEAKKVVSRLAEPAKFDSGSQG